MLRSTLTVTTPADVTALTTVERVKAELGISDGDSDALLAIKIDEATSDIEARCRPFRRETLTETFWPDAMRHSGNSWDNSWGNSWGNCRFSLHNVLFRATPRLRRYKRDQFPVFAPNCHKSLQLLRNSTQLISP